MDGNDRLFGDSPPGGGPGMPPLAAKPGPLNAINVTARAVSSTGIRRGKLFVVYLVSFMFSSCFPLAWFA
jgi:hypothetical protein